jgi:drug/metabolite transporter (DMT)-like permease
VRLMELWVFISLGAAALQALRTALQKHLAASLPNHFVNFARFACGGPLAVVMLCAWLSVGDARLPSISTGLIGWCGLIALSQIIGTWALISAFRTRNFAVAITFSKTETLQTALLSLLIIGEALPGTAWVAIALSVVGIAALTMPTGRRIDGVTSRALREGAVYGLFSGLLFGLSATAIRSASLTLSDADTITRSLLILAISTSLQFLLFGAFLLVRDPVGFASFFRAWRPAAAIGVTSVAGSACWFTAMTLEKAAYVQVVGQIEIVLSILVSRLMFQERIAVVEVLGTILFVTGLVLLLLAGEA